MERFIKITNDNGAAKKGEVYATLSRDRASVEIITKDGRGHLERRWITDADFEYVEGKPTGAIDYHDELYPPVAPVASTDATITTDADTAKPTAKRRK